MSSAEDPQFLDGNRQYHILVRFDREYADDLHYAQKRMEKTGSSLEAALREQFIAELQEGFNMSGMAGHYEIVVGPVADVGHVTLRAKAQAA